MAHNAYTIFILVPSKLPPLSRGLHHTLGRNLVLRRDLVGVGRVVVRARVLLAAGPRRVLPDVVLGRLDAFLQDALLGQISVANLGVAPGSAGDVVVILASALR